MILHSVTFKHPTYLSHAEIFHPTKDIAEKHVAYLKKLNVEHVQTSPVEVPTDSGREALAAWINGRFAFDFPSDHLTNPPTLAPHA